MSLKPKGKIKMEKTMKYTTLKGLVNKSNQYSLNTFISGQICHPKHSWVKVKLTTELYNEIENKFKDFLGLNNLYINKSYGLFDRLIINKRNLEVSYIAGQDYPSELRYLKKLIKGVA